MDIEQRVAGFTAEGDAVVVYTMRNSKGYEVELCNMGAAIVPSSTGNSEKQIMYMQDFETSLLVATPSYALRLAEVAREMGLDPEADVPSAWKESGYVTILRRNWQLLPYDQLLPALLKRIEEL